MNEKELIEFDKKHIWHPYTTAINPPDCYLVEKANASSIILSDGKQLIDGMSSWWSAIHGYNNHELNEVAKNQLNKMSHVMFGGLTHEPAIKLAKSLMSITDNNFSNVFFSDSGSVAVEVAMKMTLQYWNSKNNKKKKKFATFKSGYHGDTWHAMSVCDPINGMHNIFSNALPIQFYTPSPNCKFDDEWNDIYFDEIKDVIVKNHEEIAAIIIEPIVQGAGGMRFYNKEYLVHLKEICYEHDILLIFDEIATGFGRTGEMFAYQHANIIPDIICLGKALTGGYLSLAVTMTSKNVAEVISSGFPGVFMHGPTFMGNPLACCIAEKSIELLLKSNWKEKIKKIEKYFNDNLFVLKDNRYVHDVRVFGAIAVVEMKDNVNVSEIQKVFIDKGIWLRPFNKLIYTMPPYIITEIELEKLTLAIINGINEFYS